MVTEIAQGVRQFSRSKNRHPVLFYYYRNVALFFVGYFMVAMLTLLIYGTNRDVMGKVMVIDLLFVAFLTGCFAWQSKGSLVESVTIDNPRQELRVVHYRSTGTRCERTIPFEGFRWDVLSARDGNRLRLFPREGRRIVVVEGYLGWRYEDFAELVTAMHSFERKKKR